MIAEKMSVNQKVEVLKYVFQFIEQLQKDLIEKLTRNGSIVTFSFVPEIVSIQHLNLLYRTINDQNQRHRLLLGMSPPHFLRDYHREEGNIGVGRLFFV